MDLDNQGADAVNRQDFCSLQDPLDDRPTTKQGGIDPVVFQNPRTAKLEGPGIIKDHGLASAADANVCRAFLRGNLTNCLLYLPGICRHHDCHARNAAENGQILKSLVGGAFAFTAMNPAVHTDEFYV